MQNTANATTHFPRVLGLLRAALAARPAAARAAESFAVYVPGRGSAGFYPTFEQAEKARLALSFTSRQRAIICDSDGNALYR